MQTESLYRIEDQNYMTCIHYKEVNKIVGWNLIHDIINHPKRNKILNIHYSPIIYGCMNNRIGKAKFKNFWILLESGCSSTIVMGGVVEKLFL